MKSMKRPFLLSPTCRISFINIPICSLATRSTLLRPDVGWPSLRKRAFQMMRILQTAGLSTSCFWIRAEYQLLWSARGAKIQNYVER